MPHNDGARWAVNGGTRARICVARVGGSNRDYDVAECLRDAGARVDVLHFGELLRCGSLAQYGGLVFPGGFADGDYVRAGAIWGKKLRSLLNTELLEFAAAGKPILGICNGFQVLVEAGLLPECRDELAEPEATLAPNASGRFECRWVNLRKNAESKCIFVKKLRGIVRFPIAHGEGRFFAGSASILRRMIRNGQVVLQYSDKRGRPARLTYPTNPNGSVMDIAGICSASGTIFGLMPHPENACYGYQTPDWTARKSLEPRGDGFGIFSSMVDYIESEIA